MYGYIRPDRSQLRLRELENYQAAYCGLCHALSAQCGVFARLTVSYDLTLLAMLLSDKEAYACTKRCIRHPFSKRKCLCASTATKVSAERGMILSWWKLQDSLQDERGIKRIVWQIAGLFLRKSYMRAAQNHPEFDRFTAQQLEKLRSLEQASSSSIDRTADCFAKILSACAQDTGEKQRILEELLYHVGRIIFLLDAADDREEDEKTGSYNPLVLRYPLWDKEAQEAFRRTLSHSFNSAEVAFHLLPDNAFTPIVENILTLGLPQMTDMVLSGQWRNRKKLLREKQRESGKHII